MAKPTPLEEIINRAIPLEDYTNCLPKRQAAISRRWKLKEEIENLYKVNDKPQIKPTLLK